MGLKWDPEQNIKKLKLGMKQRLNMAAITWVNYATRQLNQKVNRDGKTPSKPGEYPAMVTSHLRRSIAWESVSGRLAVRVGTNVRYGKFLELKRGQGKRPWMKLTNTAVKPKLRQIIGRPFKMGRA